MKRIRESSKAALAADEERKERYKALEVEKNVGTGWLRTSWIRVRPAASNGLESWKQKMERSRLQPRTR